MIRFRLQSAAAVAATAILAAACNIALPGSSPQPSPGAGTPLVLVVSGTYAQSGDAYALMLDDVDPEMTWFDDRPFRHAGVVPLQQGLDALYSDETDGPPNAALAVADPAGGPDQVIVVELTDAHYDPAGEGTLTFTATPLSAPKTGLDYYAGRTTDSFPSSFGAATLFIDTIVGYNYCGASIQNNGPVTLALAAQSGSWDSTGQPPNTIAAGNSATFEAQSSWASDCNMQVAYFAENAVGGFQLSVESPATGSNSSSLQATGAGGCQMSSEGPSWGGSTATVNVTVSCQASSSP
jgi:hypothetical protein